MMSLAPDGGVTRVLSFRICHGQTQGLALLLFLLLYRAGGRPEPDEVAHPLVPAPPPAGFWQTGWSEQTGVTRSMLGLERPRLERRRAVRLGNLTIGGTRQALIAGPCSVEPGYVEQALALAAAGVDALRAGVFKPRTHPDSFQGMGLVAMPLLEEV